MGVPFCFLHAADLHLDSPFRGLAGVPEAVRRRLRESTFAALERLTETVLREGVDFVVLAGDLYDHEDRSLRAQLRFRRTVEAWAEAGVQTFVAHGNHDPRGGWQARLDWPESVHVFGCEEVECRPAYRRSGELAAFVYGVSYREAAVRDNLAARFRKREGAPFHLAVLHANVDGDPRHDNYAPCSLGELAAAGFDYWALGHVHERRVLREYPHVVYPGNTQGRHFREKGARGAYVVHVSATGEIRLTFVETSDVVWLEQSVSIAGAEREQELRERLLEAAERARAEAGGRPCVLRLRLEGRGPLHERLQETGVREEWLAELREWLGSPDERDDWVWAGDLVVRTGPERDWQAELGADGFTGELARLAARAADDPAAARELLDDALASIRLQPLVREWLARRSDAERADWIRRGAETAVWLLKAGERI